MFVFSSAFWIRHQRIDGKNLRAGGHGRQERANSENTPSDWSFGPLLLFTVEVASLPRVCHYYVTKKYVLNYAIHRLRPQEQYMPASVRNRISCQANPGLYSEIPSTA